MLAFVLRPIWRLRKANVNENVQEFKVANVRVESEASKVGCVSPPAKLSILGKLYYSSLTSKCWIVRNFRTCTSVLRTLELFKFKFFFG